MFIWYVSVFFLWRIGKYTYDLSKSYVILKLQFSPVFTDIK